MRRCLDFEEALFSAWCQPWYREGLTWDAGLRKERSNQRKPIRFMEVFSTMKKTYTSLWKEVSREESLSNLGNKNTRYHEELKRSAWTRRSSTSYFNKGMGIELVPVSQLESVSPFSVFSWSIDLDPLPLTSSPHLHHLSLLEHWPFFLEKEGSTSVILPPSSLLLRCMCAKLIHLCPTLWPHGM